MSKGLVYVHYEDGTKAPYNCGEDAMAQAAHNAKFGFGVPTHIGDESGEKVQHDRAAIEAESAKL